MGSGDAQAVAVEFSGMIFAAHEGPDLGDTRQVRGVELPIAPQPMMQTFFMASFLCSCQSC